MLVNILLVLLPLAFLLVSSIWIVRTLRLSHSMSMMKRRSRALSSVNNHTTQLNGAATANHCAGDTAPQTDSSRRSRVESLRAGDGAQVAATTSAATAPAAFSKRTTPSREVTFLLVTVVLVAVFCQTPLAVFHFVRYAYTYHCGDTVYYLESFSKFLVNLNSCVNFVIYCLLSPKFRRMLKDALTCRWRGVGGGAGGGGAGPRRPTVSRMQFEFSVRESVKRRIT